MTELEIRIFVEAVTHYFNQLGEGAAVIRTSYVGNGAQIPQGDFCGTIHVSGAWRGHVVVSASARIMRSLLRSLGDPSTSAAAMLDAVGELANTIAGNARRHYSERLAISVPETHIGPPQLPAQLERIFIIDVDWNRDAMAVIVMLEPATAPIFA